MEVSGAAEFLQLGQDAALPPESSSFTALLELQPTPVVELLHSHDPHDAHSKPYCHSQLNFHQNADLTGHQFPESSEQYGPPTDLSRVKKEEVLLTHSGSDSDHPSPSSLPSPIPPVKNQKSVKRKEPEKKTNPGKESSKKSLKKVKSEEDKEQLPYVHVRARRGQATDSHSLAERARREKINARMKLLQDLVPGCSKISGIALVLDEIINHVQSLQRQVEFLSMRLAATNPRDDFNLDYYMAEENSSFVDDGNFLTMHPPLDWLEPQDNGFRQPFHSQWQYDAYQPLCFKEENHNDFSTPDNTFLSHNISPESAPVLLKQLKVERP